MKKYLFIFCLLVIGNFTYAQEEEEVVDPYSEAVKECLKGNGTYDYYANVVDQMFGMLKQQYASKNVPESVWKELEQTKESSLDELSQMLVSAYRGHFTLDDVHKMNALYNTDLGKKMFDNSHELNEGEKVVLTEFYDSEVGKKIIGSQKSMENVMVEITEFWSRDFYNTIVSTLEEKGYSL